MDFPGPSTYTPFFRRFTNERAQELEETRALFAWVKAAEEAFAEDKTSIGKRVYRSFRHLGGDVENAFIYFMLDVLNGEHYLDALPPPEFETMNLAEFVEYRNLLHAKQYFLQNQSHLLPLMEEGVTALIGAVTRSLPELEDPTPFTIPMLHTLPDVAQVIEHIFAILGDAKRYDRGIFVPLADHVYRNVCRASGRNPDNDKSTKPLKSPSESGLLGEDLVRTYLGGTPFAELFMTPVPLKLSLEDRFSHIHIVGGTGAGKTTLIEHLILHDLKGPDPPSLVVIDPHSDLIKKLARADLGIENRLIVIDPRDIAFPPALNVFALNQDRLGHYDEATREQVTAGVIQTFDYLFSGLIGADLTAKQGVFFRYVARLMLSLPETLGRNATILDMLALMADPAPYAAAIAALPDLQCDFFERDFAGKTFQQTKEQIRYRLQAILENPTIARLFTSPETKLDLFTEMNRGAVILVDTAKDFLKGASANFGRIIISLVLQAVLERAAIPAKDRKPTFLIVDEAASYFDSNIDDLLTEARKYRCGLVLAHQYLDQASPALRASLAANTATKFASGLSAGDARTMAHEMRTSADFIHSQPRLQFAAHIRNVTPQAVSIPIRPVGALPQLSDEAFAALMERNRERVSLPPQPARQAPSARDIYAPSEPNEDISDEW